MIDQVTRLGGKAAVVGFLVLSGFSIGASVNRAEGGFYLRRALRIYPSYLVAVILTVLVQTVSGGFVRVPSQEFHASGAAVVVGNLLFLQTMAVSAIGFNYSLWSLAVEVVYYAIAPRLPRIGVALLMVGMLVSAVSFTLPTRFDHGIVYAALTKLKIVKYFWCWGLGFWLWNNSGRAAIVLAALLSMGLVVIGVQTTEPLSWVPVGVTLSALYLATVVRFGRRLRSICDYLGDLSYPLYLTHLPTLILGWTLGLRGPGLFAFAAAMAVLCTFAVEHRLRPRLSRVMIGWSAPQVGPVVRSPAEAPGAV